ncbi:MAG: hypothetical protein GX335_08470 [Firmicutes bacterium]|nr:hypothetical protein [Bacillota bacterium]
MTQITTVADVVDAMTSERPYRPALTIEECFRYLEEEADEKFNRDLVEVCKKVIKPKEVIQIVVQ